jgi:hypothetical protein
VVAVAYLMVPGVFIALLQWLRAPESPCVQYPATSRMKDRLEMIDPDHLKEKKEKEDEAVKLVDGMSKFMKLTVYELLNRGHGCTMTNIEFERRKAWKDEREKQK